jgi:hypothetical protein
MATAKKVPAKKVAVKKAVPEKKAPKEEQKFAMPVEVQEWIERASSTMKHQANQIATMKEEIAQLKAYKKFAANKIQGMSFE